MKIWIPNKFPLTWKNGDVIGFLTENEGMSHLQQHATAVPAGWSLLYKFNRGPL